MEFTNASFSPRQRMLLKALRGPTLSVPTPPQIPSHHRDIVIASLRAEVRRRNLE